METFPFKKVIIALIVIMVIVAGVGLYLGSGENDLTPTTTTPTTTTPTTTTPTTTTPTTTTPTTTTPTTTTPTTTTPTTTTPTTTTPTPQMTPEEQTYAITIATHTSILNQALSALSLLMANLQIGDAQWTTDIAIQLAIIQSLYNEAMAIDPPSSMASIHDKYVQAMEHYNTATQLITQGIEEADATLLEESTAEINTGTQLLTEAIALLNEFTEA